MSSPDKRPRFRDDLAPWGVGIVGGGDICGRYAQCLGRSRRFEVVAVARRDIPTDDLINDPRVDIVANLTPPLVHAEITQAALEAGKHVYSEKPLAHNMDAAKALIELAQDKGLILACAPATFLGPALQTVRGVIDRGELGQVIGARGIMLYPGPNHWHHNPAPLFGSAAGPLFDMGVYHLSALVALLGPIVEVSAMGNQAYPHRRIGKGPKAGEMFDVTTPTHITALIRFLSGAIADLTFSFDGLCSHAPPLEIFGTKGSMSLPQPSQFDGSIKVATEFNVWRDIETGFLARHDDMWIAGLLAMADHLEGEDTPIPSAQLALHVLDAMTNIEVSLSECSLRRLTTTCVRPAAIHPAQFEVWAQSYERAA